MPLTDTGVHNALNNVGVTHIGLFSDYSTEVTGGSPAYARKATTPSAAASRQKQLVPTQLEFDVPAGTVVNFVSAHDALTSGNVLDKAPIGSSKSGVATVAASDDLFLSKGHTLSAGNRVVVFQVANEAIPTGLTVGTVYYVIASGLTADAFKLSATSGGTAVDITADGEVFWMDCVPATDAAQFVLRLLANSFNLDGRAIK